MRSYALISARSTTRLESFARNKTDVEYTSLIAGVFTTAPFLLAGLAVNIREEVSVDPELLVSAYKIALFASEVAIRMVTAADALEYTNI